MDTIALIENSLTLAAERLGDITPLVMENFYARFPACQAVFERLSLGKPHEMEGEMVTQTVYSLLAVVEQPEATGIMLDEEVIQHQYYEVPVEYFNGFIDSTVDVILAAIADEMPEGARALNAVRETLKSIAAERYAEPVTA